jgi:hypothetical protein
MFSQQADTPVDAVVRELATLEVPGFRADTCWFPRQLVLDAALSSDSRWIGELSIPHRAVRLEAIRSIWCRDSTAFSFADDPTDPRGSTRTWWSPGQSARRISDQRGRLFVAKGGNMNTSGVN